jgi:antitoxin Phd
MLLTNLVSDGGADGELVQKAIDDGPQTVTRRGQPAVVVLSAEQFELMKKRQIDLKDLLPFLSLDEADLERSKDFPRDVEL